MSFFSKLKSMITGCSQECGGAAAPAGKSVVIAAGSGSFDAEGFVGYVAKSLVDYPDEVSVTVENREDDSKAVQIRCRKSDIGKLVGKHGKTITAIRSLVSGAAGRNGCRISVDVLD